MGFSHRAGCLFRAFSIGVLLMGPLTARAYTPTISASGVSVRWPGISVKLDIVGNPINASGIDPSSFSAAVVHGLQRWQSASGGRIGFDYWQGTDPSNYEPNSSFNGHSSVYFASNGGANLVTPNVLGLTQVWYNTQNGQIMEADTVLNDRDFILTTDPHDTSGYGSGGSGFYSGRPHVYIENVLTHEFGHSLGLSHSGGMQSTMLFMESPEQAHLGCDEQIAIHALYPSGDAGARGALTGAVVDDSGAAIFGAQVVAVSRRRGTELATSITDRNGHYTISGLEPGSYFLMVEPYYAGAQALPGYFSAINTGVCAGGSVFSRSVLTDSTGYRPQAVGIGASSTTTAPTLVGHCGSGTGAAINGTTASGALTTAPSIYDGTDSGFGAVDRLSGKSEAYYRIHAFPGGHLELRILDFSLYSPIRTAPTLLDGSGNPVASAQNQDEVYVGDSGYVNYDSAVIADGLAPGDYYLSLNAIPMNGSYYPAGPVSLDTTAFVMIAGSINEPAASMADVLPDNARCRMAENFATYQSPGGTPPRHSTDTSSGGIGFCGTIATLGSGSGGGGSGSDDGGGPTASAIAGWFLPWIIMLLAARLTIRALRLGTRAALAQPAQGR